MEFKHKAIIKTLDEVKEELGTNNLVNLSLNKNPLGTSIKVKESLKSLDIEIKDYSYLLRSEISKKLNISEDMIVSGFGISTFIHIISEVFINKDDESIIAENTFMKYGDNTRLRGAIPVRIPLRNYKLDIEKMVDSITKKTKVIWFNNPNDITGSIFTEEELYDNLSSIPEEVIIVMYESYIEYAEDDKSIDTIRLLKRFSNLIILRDISNMYGIESFDMAYCIGNVEIIESINKILTFLDNNLLNQKVAIEAIKDDEFLNKSIEYINEERDYISLQLDKMGLEYIKSETNFMFINVKCDDNIIYEFLLRNGYLIKPGFLIGIPGWIRVSIGTKSENREFLDLLYEVIEEQEY